MKMGNSTARRKHATGGCFDGGIGAETTTNYVGMFAHLAGLRFRMNWLTSETNEKANLLGFLLSGGFSDRWLVLIAVACCIAAAKSIAVALALSR